MMKKRNLIAVVGVIFSLCLISGAFAGGKTEAGAATGEKKVITFWNHALSGNAWETQYWQDIIAGFQKENPNVQVDLEWVPWDVMWTKLVAAVQAGNAPDLHHAGDLHMLAFVPQGKVLAIDDVLNDLGGPKAFSPLLHYYQWKGHTYGLPYVEGGYLFYYNKDLLAKAGFSQPPKNWDELIKVAQAVTDPAKGVYGLGLDYSAGNGDSQVFACFRWAAGGEVINDAGKVVFDSPQNLAALKYYTDLGTKYKVVPPGSVAITAYETTATPLLTMFGNQQIAMMVYWQLGADQIKAQFPDTWAKTGITTIPIGPSGHSGSMAAANPIYIHSQTKYPEEAKKFIKYFFKKDIYGKWIEGSGWIPGLNAAWATQPDTEWRRVSKAQMPDMWRGLGAANPQNGAAWEAFIDAAAVQDVVVRNMSPEDALKKGQKAYEDIYYKKQ